MCAVPMKTFEGFIDGTSRGCQQMANLHGSSDDIGKVSGSDKMIWST